jgi:hypothetical protein
MRLTDVEAVGNLGEQRAFAPPASSFTFKEKTA